MQESIQSHLSLLNDGVFTKSEGLQYIDYGRLNGDYRYLVDFSPSQAISNVAEGVEGFVSGVGGGI